MFNICNGYFNFDLKINQVSTIKLQLRYEDLDETFQTSSSLRLIKYYFALNSQRIEPSNRPVSRVNKWFKFALRRLGGTTSSFSHAQLGFQSEKDNILARWREEKFSFRPRPIYIYQTGVFVMLLNSQVIKVGLCAITSRHTIRGKLVSVQLLTGRIVFSLLVYRSQFILGNLSLTTIERFNSNWLHNVASKVLNFNGDILCSLYFIRVRGNYEIIV